jgi:hypothetical protein
MAGIAISYRREDTGWITGRIFDRLKNHYDDQVNTKANERPVVFLDYDSIAVGVDFRDYIKGILDKCNILLAVIGPHWIGHDTTDKPRISRSDDWVRIEIETALKNNIPIIPVLIDRTPMPNKETLPQDVQDIVYRQAAIIDTQVDFNSHMERLIRQIDRLIGEPHAALTRPAPIGIKSTTLYPPPLRTGVVYGLAAIALCALGIALWLFFHQPTKILEPTSWTVYSSPDLGVTVTFPRNIFSLDTTERKEHRLFLRDSNGERLVHILRSPLPDHNNVQIGRQQETDDLKKMDYTLTYIAPENDRNWSNWYVLSGVKHGTEFYFRRWYSDDSVVSLEFKYPKELASLFEKLIPTMTHEFAFTSAIPKT